MQTYPDGSILLSPGETPPSGYHVIQQYPDGRAVAVDESTGRQSTDSSNSSIGKTALTAYGGYKGAQAVGLIGQGGGETAGTAGLGGGAAATGAGAIGGSAAPAGYTATEVTLGSGVPQTVYTKSAAAGAGGGGSGAAASGGSWGGPSVYAGGPNVAGAAIGAALIGKGAYDAHKQYSHRNQGSTGSQGAQGAVAGAEVGAGIGMYFGGYGAVIGGVIGGIIGGAAGLARGAFGGRKSGYELMQRAVDHAGGMIGLYYDRNGNAKGKDTAHVRLADGTLYSIEDGGYKGAGHTASFTVDPSATYGKQAVEWSIPIAEVILGAQGTENLRKEGATTYLSGTLANAALSNAGGNPEVVRANLLKQLQNVGINYATAKARLLDLKNKNVIDQAQYNHDVNALDRLFHGGGSYDAQTMGQFTGQGGTTEQPPPSDQSQGEQTGTKVANQVALPPQMQTQIRSGATTSPGTQQQAQTTQSTDRSMGQTQTGARETTDAENDVNNQAEADVDAAEAAANATSMAAEYPAPVAAPPTPYSPNLPAPYALGLQPQLTQRPAYNVNWNFVRGA